MVTMPGSRIARACLAGAILLSAAATPSCARPPQPAPATTPPVAATPTRTPTTTVNAVPNTAFASVATLVDDDIAAHRLPGAVVQIGHEGEVVYRQAFGDRKLDGEPGLDGSPAPAEAMTPDTIFDLASLSKPIATTPAVLQLYEQGKVSLDDPVQMYFPEFNPANDPRRAQVTIRMLLTHTSGIGGDLSHEGPWGLIAADKADGIHRALAASLEFEPAAGFHYSDVGFIILGALVEKITGEPLDVYVQDHVFAPLGMADTRYLPASKACGPHRILGNAIVPEQTAAQSDPCADGAWSTDLLQRVAPTAHDEDTPGINPDYDRLIRGTVHDPTARRMGGVAGNAGVFSTAPDLGKYAQALLDRRAGRPSTFPLKQSTVELMTTPQQPASAEPDLRGFGWDIDTSHSRPRGTIFPVGSFGHVGFTGVSLWMDPESDSYVVVLANVIHQRGGPPIVTLSGNIATAAAQALHLYGS
ncbi:MAG: serine hydrolase domain-containing protein [Mycobacterium sp.]